MQLSIYLNPPTLRRKFLSSDRWWEQVDSNYQQDSLCEFGTFPRVLTDTGGNKWTRTTDLTLIRRVL